MKRNTYNNLVLLLLLIAMLVVFATENLIAQGYNFKPLGTIKVPLIPRNQIFQDFSKQKDKKCYHTVMTKICIENGKRQDDVITCVCYKINCANLKCGQTFRLEGRGCPRLH